ncbi:MAG: hypothetical protein HRU35_07800, partial [Rickettsiaceae bacterium]|nr:hypothetical protein [Rickettsiaceae bacterium]
MVKRKYLSINSLFLLKVFFLLFLLTFSSHTYGSAWLPEAGSYKYLSSFAVIDKKSRKAIKKRENLYQELQTRIFQLRALKNAILNQQELSYVDNIRLKQIDERIKHYDKLACELRAFTYREMGEMTIEYGINDESSFGTKIGYTIEEFKRFKEDINIEKNNNIDFFYKFKLLEYNNWIITVQPKIHLDHYKNQDQWSQELGLFLAYSWQVKTFNNPEKVINHFTEVGVYYRDGVAKHCPDEVSIA